MTAAVFFFFFPVQRRRLLPFLQWCCNGGRRWWAEKERRCRGQCCCFCAPGGVGVAAAGCGRSSFSLLLLCYFFSLFLSVSLFSTLSQYLSFQTSLYSFLPFSLFSLLSFKLLSIPPLFSFVNSLCLSPFFSLSRPLACWRCGGVFIGQKGAGASLLPPYSSAWGAGLCCPATAPGWLANGWGWQGAASLVSSWERMGGGFGRHVACRVQ